MNGQIEKIAGPVVVASGVKNARMFDIVRVGEQKLIGEIIRVEEDRSTIQVYEQTEGLRPGEPVVSTHEPLSVELGPGIISSIYDGIQRPLDAIKAKSGDFILKGVDVPSLYRDKKWKFVPKAKKGDNVEQGDVLGTVKETSLVVHKILVPVGIKGTVRSIKEGEFKVTDVVAKIKEGNKTHELTMMQKWPVRKSRPYKKKIVTETPLVTGQRIVDAFFPVSKGGTASIPGPFGAGKTVLQHALSKWSDADIILFIGCGERGNEMTDVLTEFPHLKDPKTGKPLMERTVLIANTSNMPVAAREASIYTGITIAEYFRDMGYSVALMADSTSRWAEAMREISGRLEEMPGEEGYPSYIGSRLAEFYERAGRVHVLGQKKKEGVLTVVGAVSPPGGDFSEPVTQSTLRVTKVFWALDAKLASSRHFPSINWLESYSLYAEKVALWWASNVGSDWQGIKSEAMSILQKESELEEIVRLVGMDALPEKDKLVLDVARMIREDFLQQNAFDDIDAYTSLKKQYRMMKLIINYHRLSEDALDKGVDLENIFRLPIRTDISKMKFIAEDSLEKEFDARDRTLASSIKKLDKGD